MRAGGTYSADPESRRMLKTRRLFQQPATRLPELAWQALTTMAERVLDLPRAALR